jgi:uncharacterized membrane protein
MLIKADHDTVEHLYQRYQSLDGHPTEQRAVAEQICHELTVHATLEEEIFYPAVQARLGKAGTDLVAEAVKEHGEMKRLIRQLHDSTTAAADCDRLVHTLMRGVQHHVREEEDDMLPQAAQLIGGELEHLGLQMQERKQALQAEPGALAERKTVTDKAAGGTSTIEQSIDVHVPVRTVYNQWTQFKAFPQFMQGIEQVTQLDDTHLHWKARIGGTTKEWDAVITEQIPDERVAWTNTTGTRNAGVVTFHRLSDQHTRIMLQLDYEPEGVLENLGDLLGVVSARVRGDLERFKAFIESRGAATGAWRGTVEQQSA